MADGESPPVTGAGLTRIVVADDHPLFRGALVRLLEARDGYRVVGETADGQEAIDLCRRLRPELLLTDVRMPRIDGLEVARAIKREFPYTIVMILTALEDPDYLSQALKAGAAGYILKYATAQQIVDAVRKVLDGEYSLDHGIATELLLRLMEVSGNHSVAGGHPEEYGNRLPHAGFVEPLTPREADVLRLIARGRGNQEIARDLFVSLSTVKKYVHRLFVKLEVSDRTRAAIKAIELGLLVEKEGHR